jgi:hypothetical protein
MTQKERNAYFLGSIKARIKRRKVVMKRVPSQDALKYLAGKMPDQKHIDPMAVHLLALHHPNVNVKLEAIKLLAKWEHTMALQDLEKKVKNPAAKKIIDAALAKIREDVRRFMNTRTNS